MKKHFKRVALVGLPRHIAAIETHRQLYIWLQTKGYAVIMEDQVAKQLGVTNVQSASLTNIVKHVDLMVVIGGDGNMLRAARAIMDHDIKVIGINRGSLGFLTDIPPEDAYSQLSAVLQGEYVEDSRFLLCVEVKQHDKIIHHSVALNEVVLHPDKVVHMIDFDVNINGHKAFSQRADGLIIATPTGSTAYSLSAGGPILEPNLDAIVITPMFPHSLSVRPLVIHSSSHIQIHHHHQISIRVNVTCDSQHSFPVKVGETIHITQHPKRFSLIHTRNYDYFSNLSGKLGWSKQLF